jgi:hypothetical protein
LFDNRLIEDLNPTDDNGLVLTFTVKDDYLVAHTLGSMGEARFSSTDQRGDIVALQNLAWSISEPCYDLVAGRRSERFFARGGNLAQVPSFLAAIIESAEFQTVKLQTLAYSDHVKAQWEHHYPAASGRVHDLTGIALNRHMTVLVTHPSLRNGQNLGNNTITWGHHEDFPNYATVYLWHEALHSDFDISPLSHALIQFIADNELRATLDASQTYPPFEGHDHLFPLMDQVLPHWQTYLSALPSDGNRGDIRSFQTHLESLPAIQEAIRSSPPTRTCPEARLRNV